MLSALAQKMKILACLLIATLSTVASAFANSQVERLKKAYEVQGDSFFAPLYWLPETQGIVSKHIDVRHRYVGYGGLFWEDVAEEDKLKILNELGADFERLEAEALESRWKRIRDWPSIKAQLYLIAGFLEVESDETWPNFAYSDPTLRPAFKSVLENRPPDFVKSLGDKLSIGDTMATGELESLYGHLVEVLLDATERERLECFSRLFAQLAAMKPAEDKEKEAAS